MNHSFKKNIAFTFLTLGGILSLSSCKDSDMEVFVAQDTRNQKLIEAIKAIPEPKKEVADEDIEEDKDYIYLMPVAIQTISTQIMVVEVDTTDM